MLITRQWSLPSPAARDKQPHNEVNDSYLTLCGGREMTRREALFVCGKKAENGMRRPASHSHKALIAGSSQTVFDPSPLGTATRLGTWDFCHKGALSKVERSRIRNSLVQPRPAISQQQVEHATRKSRISLASTFCPSVLASLSPPKMNRIPLYHDVP
jgi:hypothetical protein